MQALGRLQRETFYDRGSRLKPGEFAEIVASRKTPSHLSQEGQRSLTYARDVMKAIDSSWAPVKGETESFKKHKKAKAKRLKKTFLNRVDQILPTVVKEDRSPRDSRMA